jgi:hypothetical protein
MIVCPDMRIIIKDLFLPYRQMLLHNKMAIDYLIEGPVTFTSSTVFEQAAVA